MQKKIFVLLLEYNSNKKLLLSNVFKIVEKLSKYYKSSGAPKAAKKLSFC